MSICLFSLFSVASLACQLNLPAHTSIIFKPRASNTTQLMIATCFGIRRVTMPSLSTTLNSLVLFLKEEVTLLCMSVCGASFFSALDLGIPVVLVPSLGLVVVVKTEGAGVVLSLLGEGVGPRGVSGTWCLGSGRPVGVPRGVGLVRGTVEVVGVVTVDFCANELVRIRVIGRRVVLVVGGTVTGENRVVVGTVGGAVPLLEYT